MLKKGSKVIIKGSAEEEKYKGCIFEVLSDPYEICGSMVVKMKCHDGKQIINVNQVVLEERKIVCNKWVLGEYSSEVAALNIMDTIAIELDIMLGMEKFAVFQMPQK